jgi:hypothetical protein
MANKTAAQITDKYKRKMAASGPDYQAGVQNPSRPWEDATIKGADRWNVGVQQAISQGSFASGVRGKGDKWTRKVTTVGVQRYSAAAEVAATEYGAVAQKIIDITSQVAGQVRAMDNSTDSAREQRALENMRRIKAAWKASR